MQILKPGGTLLTYSCSGLMDQVLFQKIIADAALDANRQVKFVERFEQAADHPKIYTIGSTSRKFICRHSGREKKIHWFCLSQAAFSLNLGNVH